MGVIINTSKKTFIRACEKKLQEQAIYYPGGKLLKGSLVPYLYGMQLKVTH